MNLPFLRWAGGKRWLSRIVGPALKERLQGTYFEPFLGAGAMFFSVSPRKALLSDLNSELINAFQVVAKNPDRLIDQIRKIPVTSESYYQTRSSTPQSDFERAVRFIYLNRTCYGGLYRENKNGEFNTPYGGGRTPAPLWENGLVSEASKLLSGKFVKLIVQDFAESIKLAKQGDVIYCDPTYRSVTRSQFDRYGSILFRWSDQERLAVKAKNAFHRGALVLISNTYCEEIRQLYEGALFIPFSKPKSIGNRPKNSNNSKEYLIVLDPENNTIHWANLGNIKLP